MIKRKIDNYLADFFATDKKALMLTGARQIGKYCCPLKLRPSRARVCMHMQALKNKKLG